MKYEAEVVVVGGGLAGAMIAAALAQQGRQVLVLEAGAPIYDRMVAIGRYAASPGKGLATPYADELNDKYAHYPDSAASYEGDKRFKSTYMRRAGGSTWHWQGSTPRLLPNDFRMRSAFGVGVDWPLSYEELEKWYALAEIELGVAGDRAEWDGFYGGYRSTDFPMPSIWPSYSDRELTKRIEGLEIDGREPTVRRTPQARNSQPYQGRPACAGNSTCIPICPIGAKYDATVHLRKAVEAGAQLVTRAIVSQMRFLNDQVEALEIKEWSETGVVESEARSTTGVYVLAAHAIETARLLLLSNARDRSNQLGRNLMDHPTGQIVGLTSDPIYPFRGPPVTSGIDDWRDGAFRATSASWKLSLGNDGHGRFRPEDRVRKWMDEGFIGTDLRKKIESDGTRFFRMSWASEQLPEETNFVTLSSTKKDDLGLPREHLTYDVGAYTRTAFSTIRSAILSIFERAGVRAAQMDPDPLNYGGSGHIMGTCRMGHDATKAVVDANGCSFQYPKLFVVGSATFPTVGTANPSLTVAALALRAAGHIQAKL